MAPISVPIDNCERISFTANRVHGNVQTYQSYDQSTFPIAERQVPILICLVGKLFEEVWHLEEPRNLTSIIACRPLGIVRSGSRTSLTKDETTHRNNHGHRDNSRPEDLLHANFKKLGFLLRVRRRRCRRWHAWFETSEEPHG